MTKWCLEARIIVRRRAMCGIATSGERTYSQEKSLDALASLAMPPPCPIYRNRKPTVRGIVTLPKFIWEPDRWISCQSAPVHR